MVAGGGGGGGVGGGDCHDAGLCCCLEPAAPIGLSPLPLALALNPLPPQAAAPIGLPPPRALPPSACPIFPPPPTPPSLAPGVCPNEAPGLSLCHCSVSGPHGGGQLPSALPQCVQADTPVPAVGGPSPTAAFRPRDDHLGGHLPITTGGLDEFGGGRSLPTQRCSRREGTSEAAPGALG